MDRFLVMIFLVGVLYMVPQAAVLAFYDLGGREDLICSLAEGEVTRGVNRC